MANAYDNLYWYSKNKETRFPGFYKDTDKKRKAFGFWTDFQKGEAYNRPTMRYEILGIKIDKGQWKWSKERAYKGVENYLKYLEISKETGESLEEYWERTGKKLEFIKRDGNKIKYWVHPREKLLTDNNWLDIPGYSSIWNFQTENSEALLKRIIESTSNENDFVMDFFLGSGTTIAVAHKLRRKWIGVEMGEHFNTVILPRMKKVLAYDKSGISKEKDAKEKYNEKNAGGFFAYFELEQFEEALSNIIIDIAKQS
jgi:adenine-specific DNA-methyltransferase